MATTAGSAAAGVDLEMPGPGRAFGPALAAAVEAGEVDESLLDAQVTRLLTVLDRLGALDDRGPGRGAAVDRPEHRAVARRAATESMVLLANDGLLPLDRAALRTVAIIGPNADRAQIMGGGSASLRAHHLVTPREALAAALGDGVTLTTSRAATTGGRTPPLGGPEVVAPDGEPGFARRLVRQPRPGRRAGPHLPGAGGRRCSPGAAGRRGAPTAGRSGPTRR